MTKKDKPLETKLEPKDLDASEAPRLPPVERRLSFEQWAARSGIPLHNRRGRKAFIKNPNTPRTLSEWDELFKNF